MKPQDKKTPAHTDSAATRNEQPKKPLTNVKKEVPQNTPTAKKEEKKGEPHIARTAILTDKNTKGQKAAK